MGELIEIQLAEAPDLVCPPAATLRQAMARLNVARYPFQIVLGDDMNLIGTVTDGDLRRALLLPNLNLDSQVVDAAQKTPLTGSVGEAGTNLVQLRKTRGVIPFLPLLKKDGACDKVLVELERAPAISTAVIMAGGFGKRLGELTRLTPKPLLSVAGRPILDHLLGQLEAANVKRIFIAVHHLAEQLEKFVDARQNASSISILRESEPLGTAGAIGLLKDVPDPFFVVNGDIVSQVDFSLLADGHHAHGNDATLAVAQYEVEVPYGVIRHGADGTFLGVDEKPVVRHFVASGIYVLSPPFCPLIKRGQRIDMPELLNVGRTVGLKVGLFPIHEYWRDIGRPVDLASVENDQEATRANVSPMHLKHDR